MREKERERDRERERRNRERERKYTGIKCKLVDKYSAREFIYGKKETGYRQRKYETETPSVRYKLTLWNNRRFLFYYVEGCSRQELHN